MLAGLPERIQEQREQRADTEKPRLGGGVDVGAVRVSPAARDRGQVGVTGVDAMRQAVRADANAKDRIVVDDRLGDLPDGHALRRRTLRVHGRHPVVGPDRGEAAQPAPHGLRGRDADHGNAQRHEHQRLGLRALANEQQDQGHHQCDDAATRLGDEDDRDEDEELEQRAEPDKAATLGHQEPRAHRDRHETVRGEVVRVREDEVPRDAAAHGQVEDVVEQDAAHRVDREKQQPDEHECAQLLLRPHNVAREPQDRAEFQVLDKVVARRLRELGADRAQQPRQHVQQEQADLDRKADPILVDEDADERRANARLAEGCDPLMDHEEVDEQADHPERPLHARKRLRWRWLPRHDRRGQHHGSWRDLIWQFRAANRGIADAERTRCGTGRRGPRSPAG